MKRPMSITPWLLLTIVADVTQESPQTASAATSAALVPIPPALGAPKPGPTNDAPYAPQPILQGGVVIPLYPADSPLLKKERVREAEVYNLSKASPGRINSIVNIHNPSIEVHTVESGINTGAAVILAAGGGHNTLNVGSESADFVPYFYNYGVNTVILRNRLRRDGYNVQTNAVNDALQAIRLVRAHAKEWNIDPNKIGIMGFSAGAELAAPAAIFFEEFDKKNSNDPLVGISSRPDFVALVYPGPTPCGAPPRMRLVGCLISSSTSFLSVFSVTSCSHQQAVLWHSGNQTAGRRGAPFVISAASLPARRRPVPRRCGRTPGGWHKPAES